MAIILIPKLTGKCVKICQKIEKFDFCCLHCRCRCLLADSQTWLTQVKTRHFRIDCFRCQSPIYFIENQDNILKYPDVFFDIQSLFYTTILFLLLDLPVLRASPKKSGWNYIRESRKYRDKIRNEFFLKKNLICCCSNTKMNAKGFQMYFSTPWQISTIIVGPARPAGLRKIHVFQAEKGPKIKNQEAR